MTANPVRVGLDVTAAISGDTGVARYAEGLVGALRRTDGVDTATVAFGRGGHPTAIGIDRRIPVPLRALRPWWRITGRPRTEALLGPIDVVHTIDGIPAPTRRPLVVTCHDVLPLTHPHLYDRRYRIIARRHADALHAAAAVVTTCAATASAIVEVTGIDRDRIHVAPPGRRLAATGPQPVEPGDPHLLYVGAVTPRKGLHRLVEALAELASPPRLVVAGPDGIRADEVHAVLDRHRERVHVERLGRVSDADLIRLLRRATLLCHPSEAEGFGIPVLEAMGAGLPVLAADIPPVREIGGDAVELVPVDDRAAWGERVAALLADPQRRRAMSEAGIRRSEPYTWEAMAETVAGVYRSR